MTDFTRRTIVQGTAWTIPVIAVASTAPAFAASAPPIVLTYVDAVKCPGSGKNDKQYLFHFKADSQPAQDSIDVLFLTINGVDVPTDLVVIRGTDVYVRSTSQDNSADASGKIKISYTSGLPAVTKTLEFDYDGTHPDNALCATF